MQLIRRKIIKTAKWIFFDWNGFLALSDKNTKWVIELKGKVRASKGKSR